MLVRAIVMGLAVMATATMVDAQERGTVEFGAFGSGGSYDNNLGLNSGWGGGGRIGAFLFPRLSVEFEAGSSSAPLTIGAGDNVNVGVLSGRLTAVPLQAGRVSLLTGLGVNHTDAHSEINGLHGESFGMHGLLGAKIAISEQVALRLDGIRTRMSNGGGWNNSLHLGVSLYRHPANTNTVVTRTVEMAAPAHSDSVSAAETRRLRAVEARHKALQDSIADARTTRLSAGDRATMVEMIRFANERAELSNEARATLGDKVAIFNANPSMRITIVGHASSPGTTAYNSALGLRRAEAARTFLVSQGIAESRIEIATQGESDLLRQGLDEAAAEANRRGEFRLLLSDGS